MAQSNAGPERIPEILARTDLVALAEECGGALARTTGGTTFFHCPHPDHEDRDPSFTVREGRWCCWSCAQRGDAIDLLTWLYGISKRESIEQLAERAGLHPDRPGSVHVRLAQPSKPPADPIPAGVLPRPVRRPPADVAERLLVQFVRERGWSLELAEELGLHVVLDPWRRPRVRFPWPTGIDGRTWGQDRALGDAEPRWLSPRGGVTPWPYEANRIRIAAVDGRVFVTEGVTDAVTLIDVFPGAGIIGVPGSGGFKREWARTFAGIVVVVVADNDVGGLKLRQAIGGLVGPVATLVRHLLVPAAFNDLSDWRRHDPGGFPKAFVVAAKALDVEMVVR